MEHINTFYNNLLPKDFLWYIGQFSSINISWSIDDEDMIEDIYDTLSYYADGEEVYSGHIAWDANDILSQNPTFIEAQEKKIFRDEDEKNFYSLYGNKIEFLEVPNGAAHAINTDDGSVVYLSHGDSDEYVILLGKNFNDYFTNYMKTLFIGSDILQMKYFLSKGKGINAKSKAFRELRKLLDF